MMPHHHPSLSLWMCSQTSPTNEREQFLQHLEAARCCRQFSGGVNTSAPSPSTTRCHMHQEAVLNTDGPSNRQPSEGSLKSSELSQAKFLIISRTARPAFVLASHIYLDSPSPFSTRCRMHRRGSLPLKLCRALEGGRRTIRKIFLTKE